MSGIVLPFPKGWFALGPSEKLKNSEIRAEKLAGNEILVYRTESGKLVVSDPFCPHLGAHLGHGGTIKGETIECPFHGFCFDEKGTCTSTGYGTKPPPKAILKIYPSLEANGLMMVFFDPNQNQPEWDIPHVLGEDWSPLKFKEFDLNSHPQETTENSVDLGHLKVVHGYESIKVLSDPKIEGAFMSTHYSMERPRGFWSDKDALPVEFTANLFGLGFSRVDVFEHKYGVNIRLFVMPTPTEKGKIKLRIGLSVKKMKDLSKMPLLARWLPKSFLTKIIAHFGFQEYIHDIQQDFKIWENKVYIPKAPLAKGDGPIPLYRKWAQQFYS